MSKAEFNIGMFKTPDGMHVPIIQIKSSNGLAMVFTCNQGVRDGNQAARLISFIKNAIITYRPGSEDIVPEEKGGSDGSVESLPEGSDDSGH